MITEPSPARRLVPARSAARRHRLGLSLVELLISLAITAMLLTAVATSYSASASAIEVNDQLFRATQSGRVSLAQILAAVRKCDSCQVGSKVDNDDVAALLSATSPVMPVLNKNNLDVFTPATELPNGSTIESERVSYQFDPATKRLKFIRLEADGVPEYTLASNIESCTFTADLEQNADNKQVRTIRVIVSMVVKVGNHTVRLSGSAVPRRLLEY
jgi:type II secretory pathway pseudopilin PulG